MGTPRLDLEFERPDQQWLWIFKMTDRADERGQKERRKEATKLPGEHRTSTWRHRHGRRKWGVVNHSELKERKWRSINNHRAGAGWGDWGNRKQQHQSLKSKQHSKHMQKYSKSTRLSPTKPGLHPQVSEHSRVSKTWRTGSPDLLEVFELWKEWKNYMGTSNGKG